jgi:uncharacterized lipoprotein YehR (DUF1307 family)
MEIPDNQEIHLKMIEKLDNIKERLNIINNRIDYNNENLEKLVEISKSFCIIEENLNNLEGNVNNLNNLTLEEKERIIDQKIFKTFTPYMLYLKYHLLNQ